jgi:autotransporter-associated beta strand protein
MKKILSVSPKLPRMFSSLLRLLGVLLALAPQLAPATIYNWSGLASTNWLESGNWNGGSVAPTGGTYNVVIFVTNKANNALYYTADLGSTLFTNTTAEGSGRALRIGDQAAGALYITGGTLESRGAAGDLLANGSLGQGALVVDGGSYIHTNQTILFGNAGISATLTVNSGTAMVATVQGANATNGYINLNGGLLALRQLTLNGKEQLTVNFNGGILKATSAQSAWLVATSATYNVLAGGAIFDTAGNNVTIGGALTGVGTVTKNSSGNLTLSGANNYDGATLISNGGLIVGHNTALGSTAGSTTISAAGGFVQLANGVTVAGESLILKGGGDNNGALQAGSSSTSTWAGPIYISDNSGTASPRLGAQATGVLTISGMITNGTSGSNIYISGNNGTGKVVLSGTNTYTGLTGIIRGWLVLGTDNTLPLNTALSLNVANINTDASTFDLAGHNQILAQLSGSTTNTQPMLITNTVGATTSTLTINQNVNTAYGGDIGGNVALVKGGTGALTLSGSNLTWSGNTTINSGTLILGVTNDNTTLIFGSSQGAVGPNFSLEQTFVDWAASKVSGSLPVIAMATNSGSSIVFGGALADTFLGGVGSATNTGGAVWGDTTVRLGGGSGTLVYLPTIGSGTNVLIGPVGGNNASVVKLTGVNNHDSTTLQSGTLQITSDSNLGTVPGVAVATNIVINGGTLMGSPADLPLDSKRGVAIGTNSATFNTPNGGVLRITGIISDLPGQAGSVVVTNSGQLVFNNNNSYSGGTLIQSGANLVIQGNGAMGIGEVTLNGGLLRASSGAAATTYVSNNITVAADSSLGGNNAKNLTFLGNVTLANGSRTLTAGATDSTTFSGIISDSGNGYGLTKAGAGTFTLANVNTYGGGTLVKGGVLAVTTNYALGNGLVTLSNGTLRSTISAVVLSNNFQFATASTNLLDAASDLTLTNGANLAGAGVLIKTGANILKLWGDNNALTGTFVNSNGTTWLNQDVSGSSNANWALAGGTLLFNNDNGGVNKTIPLGSLTGATGTILRAGGTLAGTTTFAVGALSANTTFDGQIQDGVNATIKSALEKLGSGTLTLSAINSFSGGTTIKSGTLAVNGDGQLGSGSISVHSGATLNTTALTTGGLTLGNGQNLTNRGTVAGGLIIDSGALAVGSGSFAGAVTNLSGGTLTPGIGGDTNFFQSLTLAGGSTNAFWIGSVTTYDMSVITNSFNHDGTGMPNLKVDFSDYSWNSGDQFTLYNNLFTGPSAFDGTTIYFQFQDAFGVTTNLYNNTLFSAVTGSGGATATNLFRINYDALANGNDITLTAIPEPASINLLLMLGAAYWLRRRLHGSRRRWNG